MRTVFTLIPSERAISVCCPWAICQKLTLPHGEIGIVVASTHGNQKTAVQIDGKDLYLGLNAYVYAEPKGTK